MGWSDWGNAPIGECNKNSNPIDHNNAVLMIEAKLIGLCDGTRYIEVYWNAGACIGVSNDPDQALTSCNIDVEIVVTWPLIGPPFNYPQKSYSFSGQCSKSQSDIFDDISDSASYYDISVKLNTECYFVQKLEIPPFFLPGYTADEVTCNCRIYS